MQSEPRRFADYAKRFANKRGVEDISKTNKNRNRVVAEEEQRINTQEKLKNNRSK